MPSKRLADALVAQLKRAESVVSDLFLEATDDGIEALEAVLAACREAVLKTADREPRGPRPAPAPRADRPPRAEGDRPAGRKRGRQRRRRGPKPGGEGGSQ